MRADGVGLQGARRIVLHGVTGSGKTTLASRLGELTGLPWFEADSLTWQPGWVQRSQEEQRRRISELCAQERWILDSAYRNWGRTLSRDSIVRWHFHSFRSKHDQLVAWEADPAMPPVLRLRWPAALEEWLATVSADQREGSR
jgi:broad-specificity NMP kinase